MQLMQLSLADQEAPGAWITAFPEVILLVQTMWPSAAFATEGQSCLAHFRICPCSLHPSTESLPLQHWVCDYSPRREDQIILNQRLLLYPVLRNRPCTGSREPLPPHFQTPRRRAREEY